MCTSRLSSRCGWMLPVLVAIAAVVPLAFLASPAPSMAPEPDPVPRRWQLDLKLGDLRLAQVPVSTPGGSTEIRRFYYLTYTVTNGTKDDVLFAPSFELTDGVTEPIRSGKDVPADVTKQVLAMLNNQFLQDQIAILGVLSQGEANAKEGVVIWPVQNSSAAELTIYASGFSGETRNIEVIDPETKKPTKITLRKTHMSRYHPPGTLDALRANDAIERIEQRWILR